MKILGILGSSRPNGNTEILLDIALEKTRNQGGEASKVILRDLTIGPCDGCNGCFSTGECIIDDDMQQVYEKIREADGIIWASPVYYWSMSGLTKMAMDRTYALNFPTLQQAGKIGGLIFVAGIRGCLSAANPFHMYFTYNHMFAAEFTWGYAGGKGDILKDEFAKKMSEEMVLQMHALFNANLTYPKEFCHPLHRHVMEKLPRPDDGQSK
ncbi:flavodoxin family protein [Thermodesulfobacteriota bacterium]